MELIIEEGAEKSGKWGKLMPEDDAEYIVMSRMMLEYLDEAIRLRNMGIPVQPFIFPINSISHNSED
jgi:hypothetical protein